MSKMNEPITGKLVYTCAAVMTWQTITVAGSHDYSNGILGRNNHSHLLEMVFLRSIHLRLVLSPSLNDK